MTDYTNRSYWDTDTANAAIWVVSGGGGYWRSNGTTFNDFLVSGGWEVGYTPQTFSITISAANMLVIRLQDQVELQITHLTYL